MLKRWVKAHLNLDISLNIAISAASRAGNQYTAAKTETVRTNPLLRNRNREINASCEFFFVKMKVKIKNFPARRFKPIPESFKNVFIYFLTYRRRHDSYVP